ncbi:MAG: hypothetical protein WCO71_04200, partial [Pseudomonadota bacterium]
VFMSICPPSQKHILSQGQPGGLLSSLKIRLYLRVEGNDYYLCAACGRRGRLNVGRYLRIEGNDHYLSVTCDAKVNRKVLVPNRDLSGAINTALIKKCYMARH